jgi:large subunit ribosomal protein L15
MQMNTLKRKTQRLTTRQRGRGGKRGKTSGRGTKGMLARAGYKRRPEMRDIIKRLPKLRGYAFNSFQKNVAIVSFELIEKHFKAGAIVSPATLVAAGIVKKTSGHFPPVKILSDGEITKKISVEGCAVSKGAKVKIEKAGGSVKA